MNNKGEWVVDGEYIISLGVGKDKDQAMSIARVNMTENQEMSSQDEAHAKLIAAAPDLLEACLAIFDVTGGVCPEDIDIDSYEKLEAALAKAT